MPVDLAGSIDPYANDLSIAKMRGGASVVWCAFVCRVCRVCASPIWAPVAPCRQHLEVPRVGVAVLTGDTGECFVAYHQSLKTRHTHM